MADIITDINSIYDKRPDLERSCTVEALRYAPHRQREMEADLGFAPTLDDTGPAGDEFIMDFHLNFGNTFQRCMCSVLLRAGVSGAYPGK
jgi:hypothetical protein